MKTRRMLSFILTLLIICSLGVPALAAEYQPEEIDSQEMRVVEEVSTVTETVDGITYYIKRDRNYNLAVGLGNGVLDCSIYYPETNTLYSEILPVDNISSISQANIGSVQLETVADAILNGTISLTKVELQPAYIVARATSSEKTKIMNELYDAGWPTSYVNREIGRMTQNGVTATLYDSVTYSIQDYDYTVLAAKTTLSALITFSGLPAAKLKKIITLVLTADGIWQTIKSITAGRFDVYAYGTKQVKIGSQQPYWAGRTVRWEAYTFDIGAGLNLKSETKHPDYDDNTSILQTGLNNYFDS